MNKNDKLEYYIYIVYFLMDYRDMTPIVTIINSLNDMILKNLIVKETSEIRKLSDAKLARFYPQEKYIKSTTLEYQ